MKKVITLAILGLFTIIFSMGFNVVAHETGHYAVANSYGYAPEMHFNSPIDNDSKAFEIDAAVAYVSYTTFTPDTTQRDAFIAAAGPLVNIFLGLFCSIFYLIAPRKDSHWALALLIISITSYVAGVSNLLPHGSSDGAVIVEYLRNV